MARKSLQILLAANKDARKIAAELGALIGSAEPDTDSQTDCNQETAVMPITASKTVRELAVEVPNATRVFEKLGIDYCCGGQKPLAEACAEAKLSTEQVLRALEEGTVTRVAADRDWSHAPLDELVDHIIQKHHTYVKAEVPRLQALIARVVGVHGKNHPELATVQAAFAALGSELATHLMKEEQILFPYVRQMAVAGKCGPSCFGTVENPIRVMRMEHDGAGEKLREMRQATNNYALPADACFSYGTLFSSLEEFEQDLHQHIHLENNILFPRAVALEKECSGASGKF
ncbi:MAG TPA: iron-sulfur cluster repair di-iron protein [Terriglobales bacterium]|nr:iron-sulfur cluster repair di-iron protein [Terriglobales bacterium]